MEFQFTHPAWGATFRQHFWKPRDKHVSIHAPRVGCDFRRAVRAQEFLEFQFTHPAWGATGVSYRRASAESVSIHAPRVGCDQRPVSSYSFCLCFNSRTPRGVRQPELLRHHQTLEQFQFTHPAWGATSSATSNSTLATVSIHAPRVGCDICISLMVKLLLSFNSRTPRGVRPIACLLLLTT